MSNAGTMFNQALSGISSIAGPALTRAYNNASGAAQKVYEVGCAGTKFLEDYSSEVKTTLHTGLDVVSMIPGIGSVASCANALWYLAEGDYANAGLSAVSMIPGVGTAVKGGTLAVKATATAVKVAPKAAKAVSGLVKAAPKAISAVSQTVSNTASALVVGGTKAKAINNTSKKAVQAFEVTTYSDFVSRSAAFDGIAGHEIWQHANLRAKGLVGEARLGTEVSRGNTVIALPDSIHADVSAAQRSLNAASQTAADNISSNLRILRDHPDIPDAAVDEAERSVWEVYRTINPD